MQSCERHIKYKRAPNSTYIYNDGGQSGRYLGIGQFGRLLGTFAKYSSRSPVLGNFHYLPYSVCTCLRITLNLPVKTCPWQPRLHYIRAQKDDHPLPRLRDRHIQSLLQIRQDPTVVFGFTAE